MLWFSALLLILWLLSVADGNVFNLSKIKLSCTDPIALFTDVFSSFGNLCFFLITPIFKILIYC